MAKNLATFAFVLLSFLAVCRTTARADGASNAECLSDLLSDRMISITQGWGVLGIDAAVAATGQAGPKLRITNKEYARGLGHHANGEITVDLSGQFKTFQTDVGLQWMGGTSPGSVIFQVFVDGKKVFQSGVMRENDPPCPVTVSVEGASELRLVANDAGDGIASDCADWADARLTRDPAAKSRGTPPVDVAAFARVLSWNPKVMSGTQANRLEEMPAEDVAPYRELLRSVDGTYRVPMTDGAGSIGLQWNEDRFPRRIELQFPSEAAVPPAASVQLQYWAGESAWQGKWQPAKTPPEKIGNRLVWRCDFREMTASTPKVRCVFSGVQQPVVLKGIAAFSRSRWTTVDICIEAARPGAAKKAEISVYNGVFLDASGETSRRCTWDGSKPLLLKVRASAPQDRKNDRTVLRFQMPGAAFGVAVEDLMANDCVYVPHANVFAAKAPSPVKPDEYLKKIVGRKTMLEEVRQKPDRDFAQAWALLHNPGQYAQPTLISLACDNRKFMVECGGAVLFNEYDHPDDPPGIFDGAHTTAANVDQWRFSSHFGGEQDLPISRSLYSGWLPSPVTTACDKNVTYRQRTFVAPASGHLAGKPAWLRQRAVCAIEYSVNNAGSEPSDARIVLQLTSPRDPGQSVRYYKVDEGFVATNNNRGLTINNDRVLAAIDARQVGPLSCKQQPEGIVLSGALPSGSSARCIVYLPAWKVAPTDYALLMNGDSWAQGFEDYWKSLLEPAMGIEIPDPLLSNIIRASQAHCLLAARNEDYCELIAPWVASIHYGPLDTESNSVIRGMDMTGHAEFARRGLDYFLKKCNLSDFIALNYTLTGNGEVLWNVGEHYERTGDKAWLLAIAPEVVRVCRWIIRQRAKTKRFDARGQRVPEYGLAPPGVSADWNRFAYRFFNDAQYCRGLELAGKALSDIGDPAGVEISEEANRYRADIRRAFHWMQAGSPVVQLRNGTWIPGDPPLLGYFGNIEGFLPDEDVSRSWCYGIELGAHHMAVNEVLNPASRDADWMADYLEDVRFLRTKMLQPADETIGRNAYGVGGYGKQQPYYCRIAELHALRDDVKPFLRSYFNTIPPLVSGEDLSFWEELEGMDVGCGAWNKTHETGWFLCQTRTMFVTERGDELWLAPFVTNHWMKDGLKVVVRNAPTRFGAVGYTIASKAAQGEIEAVVQLPENCTAKKIVLRLRHPEGKPIRSVMVQGKPHADFDPRKETIAFAPEGETITVQAKY